MCLAVEGQQVVLAEAVHLDVLHYHHLLVRLFKDGAVDHLGDVEVVSAEQEPHAFRHAPRCAREPLAAGVLAQLLEHALHKSRQPVPAGLFSFAEQRRRFSHRLTLCQGGEAAQALLKMGMLVPESGAASGVTSHATIAARSSGVMRARRCGAAFCSRAVSTAPGLTQTQRMPCSRPSSATASVRAMTPALATL